MGLFSFLGFGKSGLKKALEQGAVIIDVRTVNEYDQGRIKGSVNIPLDRVPASLDRIRHMQRPIICCCASGARSAKAISLLKANGIKDVLNGGNWMKLLKLIQNL
jgi:rhodanese-related sulfurtransferase